uniref:RNA 2-O ribose methyltransferase substrate binding domain-containing protein n=1 Tax=Tetraodon nigroviridis TaxID=99883 RepID=H3DFL9_TETNG
MAAYMRSVRRIIDFKGQFSAARRTDIAVESRRYVRGLRRKPVRVIVPEGEPGKVSKETPQFQPGGQNIRSKTDVKAAAQVVHVTVTKEQIDDLRYERALPGDKRLGRLVSIARSRTFREHQGKILLEGRRLICDALDAGAVPQMVFFSTADRLRELPLDKLRRATLIKVKNEDIKVWSDLVTPQGVIAIFSRPDPLTFPDRRPSVPLSLVCDNIRDPGNLGTMLRCAAAAGCRDVLLTKGCVDVWEPKVLRAAMGAHFRLPILPSLAWNDIESRLTEALTVHIADSSCGSHASQEMADGSASHKPSRAGDFGWVSTRGKTKNMRYEEYDSDSDGEDEEHHPRVDSKLYHENWAQTPAALVIGGETHGVSPEAVRLAGKTGGHRLFIPIVPNVDSLNSAMAASILLFEGRRQLLQRMQSVSRSQRWS